MMGPHAQKQKKMTKFFKLFSAKLRRNAVRPYAVRPNAFCPNAAAPAT
jgi:hypothetical protein